MTIKAVLFDVGGVLARICTTWGAALDAARLESPRSLEDALHADFPLFDPYQAGDVDDSAYEEALAMYLALGRDDARRVHEAILVEPYPGTEEIVDELNALGLVTGCLSNTNAPHFRAMVSGRFPAIDRLEHRFTSHELRLEKPYPEIYRAVEAVLGARPEEIVFFDDTLANVEGAKAVGWRAFSIDPAADPAAQIRQTLETLGVLQPVHRCP